LVIYQVYISVILGPRNKVHVVFELSAPISGVLSLDSPPNDVIQFPGVVPFSHRHSPT